MSHQGGYRFFEVALRADRETAKAETPLGRKEAGPRPCRPEGRPYE